MKITSGILPGQVLQRARTGFARTTISGTITAKATVPIEVTLRKGSKPLGGWLRRRVGKACRGAFQITLNRIPAGGPYQLLLQAGNEAVTVRGLFVGDVWLLAGQSNMEGMGRIDDAVKPHPLARVFSMDRRWRLARDPLHITSDSPDPAHQTGPAMRPRSEIIREGRGAGLGLPFAREMIRRTGVPQGLICAAHGGTSMRHWDPALKERESFYGSMLLSLRTNGQAIAGVLWYQGENDANPDCAPHYAERMKKLVAALRQDLGMPRLPWLMVQLARHISADGPGWNEIQEQQRALPREIRHVGCVAAIDLPLTDGIHLSGIGLRRLGVRLARLADRMVHHQRQELPPPVLDKVGIRKGKYQRQWIIIARFQNVSGGLQATGEPTGFTLVTARNEPIPRIYRSWIEGPTICLEINRPPDPEEALVYGYGRMPHANVTDGRDMAIPAFGPQPLMGGWR